MDPLSHVKFMARDTYKLTSWIFEQLPPHYKLVIDQAKFFDAFSLEVKDTRVSLGPWKDAPDGTPLESYGGLEPPDEEGEEEVDMLESPIARRRHRALTWLDHVEQRSQFIPSQAGIDFDSERRKICEGSVGVRVRSTKNHNRTYLHTCPPFTSLSSLPEKKRARTGSGTDKARRNPKCKFMITRCRLHTPSSFCSPSPRDVRGCCKPHQRHASPDSGRSPANQGR